MIPLVKNMRLMPNRARRRERLRSSGAEGVTGADPATDRPPGGRTPEAAESAARDGVWPVDWGSCSMSATIRD